MRAPLRWTRLAIAAAGYAALVCVLTWPLPARLGTALPDTTAACEMDELHSAWVLAYQTHALVTDPGAFADGNIYHPARHALFYGQTATGALPYFAPTFLATGNAVLALDCTFLLGVVLTALALHLVVVRWTGSDAAGFVAATAFVTTPWVLWGFAPSAPQYALLNYMPPIVLLAARPQLTRRAAWTLAVLVALQALVDVVYVAIAVLLPLALLAVGCLLAGGDSRAKGRRLLGAVAFGALCIVPLHVGHWLVRGANPDLAKQTWWALGQVPLMSLSDLRGPLVPMAVPYAALAVIVVGPGVGLARRRFRGVPGTAAAYVAALVVLGSAMAVIPPATPDGVTTTGILRVPLRLGVVALIGLCLAAGLGCAAATDGVAESRRRRMRALASLVVVAGMFVEHAHRHGDALGRYPLQSVAPPEPEVLRVLREPGGALLEIPVGSGAPGTRREARAMLRSTYHWRPLLNGYDGYWPAGFPERMALARAVPDPGAVAALRHTTGLELVLVRTAEVAGPVRAPWLALAARGGDDTLRLVARGPTELLFRAVDTTGTGAPAP